MSQRGNKIDAKIIAFEFLLLSSLDKSETKLNITPSWGSEATGVDKHVRILPLAYGLAASI